MKRAYSAIFCILNKIFKFWVIPVMPYLAFLILQVVNTGGVTKAILALEKMTLTKEALEVGTASLQAPFWGLAKT